MVARDFLRRRIAPLQWHSEPMWSYKGKTDAMRLSRDSLQPEVLSQVLGVLFVSKTTIPLPAEEDARPLIDFAEESISEQRRTMPVFDEWGIVPAGHRGPRPNPLAAEPEGMDVPPEQEEAEEASGGEDASGEDEASRSASSASEDEASTGANPVGEDEAARGANPSRAHDGVEEDRLH